MADNTQNTQFIDAEDFEYKSQVESYESIVLNQIKECVKVLSKDPLNRMVSRNANGTIEKSNELYEEEFNHVDTLKILMYPYYYKVEEFRDNVDKLYNQIEEFKDSLGDRKVMLYGVGKKSVSEIEALPADHILSKKLSVFKSRVARELFELLIRVYHNNKEIISEMEIDK
jgi:hypothetical protein